MNLFNKKHQIDYVVVGLGNPGLKYDNTRHNVGFNFLTYLANSNNIDIKKAKFSALYNTFTFNNKKVLLLKPQTFMNLSGKSVKAVLQYYKLDYNNLIVAYDDINLPVGKIRIKKKSSHGGQNGVRNIIDEINTDDFLKIKIGIGNKPHKDYDLADFVLSKFSESELKILNEEVFSNCEKAVYYMLENNFSKAMNEFN